METAESYIGSAAHTLVAQLSPLFLTLPQEVDPTQEEAWVASEAACHRAFATWYQTMWESPATFGLPQVPYPAHAGTLDRDIRSFAALSKIRAPELEPLRQHAKHRSKARSLLRAALQWLLAVGASGELTGNSLKVPRDIFLMKKPTETFLHGMEHTGWHFLDLGDGFLVNQEQAADMMPALQALCRACTESKKQRFLFERCDFRALNPFFRWTLVDVLRPLPQEDQQRLLTLDDSLRDLGYRRVLEFENRYAYQLRSSVIFRVEQEGDGYHFYFRWPLDESRTTQALASLGDQSPALARRVFDELIPCRPDCAPGYGAPDAQACGARVPAHWQGELHVGCMDQGWPVWGHTPADFAAVTTVAQVLYPLLKGA